MNKKSIRYFRAYLKKRKILLAGWNILRKDDNPYQNLFLPMEDIFGQVITFDTASNYFKYGKNEMNEKLIDFVNIEKPDYVFFILVYDEIDPLTLKRIKNISPGTLTLNNFADDDWRYDDFSRFYTLFIDYPVVNITDKNMDLPYKRDGIKNLSLSLGLNCKLFKDLNLDKTYDVTFIGRPNKSRVDYIKYLLDNKIDVRVWGDGWTDYPEISRAYVGKADFKESIEITNRGKINLSFTLGGYGKLQMKGRLFEVGACKGFSLVEYFDAYKKYLKEGKELIMFKSKKDLINKIKHYLRNADKREKIAKAAQARIFRDYNRHTEIVRYFREMLSSENELKNKKELKLSAKVKLIDLDIHGGKEDLKKQVIGADYISFVRRGIKIHPLRDALHAYSIEKSGKDISCCDYYVSKGIMKSLLLFKAKQAHIKLNAANFAKCVSLPQIMVKKEFFLENIDNFIKAMNGDNFELINEETTSFVSIPLLETNYIPSIEYNDFKKAFQMKFLDTLYSLYYQKKIFFHYYPYLLVILSLWHKPLGKSLIENVKNKRKMLKLRDI